MRESKWEGQPRSTASSYYLAQHLPPPHLDKHVPAKSLRSHKALQTPGVRQMPPSFSSLQTVAGQPTVHFSSDVVPRVKGSDL